jgi:hypothetical protein
MIIMSFNARGVGSDPKILALKQLIEISKPDIDLIQETMCLATKAKEVFSSFLKEWTLVTSNATELYWGLLTALKPNISVFNSVLIPSGTFAEISDKALSCPLSVLKFYGPYTDRLPFWESLGRSDLLKESNMVLGRDLNFTLSLREVWGSRPRQDPQEVFFTN